MVSAVATIIFVQRPRLFDRYRFRLIGVEASPKVDHRRRLHPLRRVQRQPIPRLAPLRKKNFAFGLDQLSALGEMIAQVESEGEVLLTERGKPRYRLSLYTPEGVQTPPVIDFWARLNAYQPEPITVEQARALHEDNRGDR